MTTPDLILDFFRRNEGLTETPPNSNRNWITSWYGLHDAWCAMTVSRACLEAGFAKPDNDAVLVPGISLDTIHGWQYVPSMVRKFQDANAFTTSPFVGAIGFIVYPSSGDWVDPWYRAPGDHVNVVESWTDDSITTWDGNVGNKLGRNTWPRDYFYGFGVLPYTQTGDDMDESTQEAIKHLSGVANKFFRGFDNVATGGDDAYSGAVNFGQALARLVFGVRGDG